MLQGGEEGIERQEMICKAVTLVFSFCQTRDELLLLRQGGTWYVEVPYLVRGEIFPDGTSPFRAVCYPLHKQEMIQEVRQYRSAELSKTYESVMNAGVDLKYGGQADGAANG